VHLPDRGVHGRALHEATDLLRVALWIGHCANATIRMAKRAATTNRHRSHQSGGSRWPESMVATPTPANKQAEDADADDRDELEPHAADAIGTNDVDFVVDEIDTRHVADCLLNKLLEIKSRQPARKVQVPSFVLDIHATDPTSKMGVAFQVLTRQCT
jgi:hypothetical protein